MQSVAKMCAQLRAHGLRVTPQRECIMRHLDGNTQHPTVEALHEATRAEMPTISLKTVYQTVHDLEALGAVRLLDLGTGSVRVDPNVERIHHHVVCDTCGAVRDVPLAFDAVKLPRRFADGFRVAAVQVLFRGTCRACDGAVPAM